LCSPVVCAREKVNAKKQERERERESERNCKRAREREREREIEREKVNIKEHCNTLHSSKVIAVDYYGLATISRIDSIIGFCCKRAL